MENLEKGLRQKILKITVDLLQNENEEFYYRLGHWQTASGIQFKHLIKQLHFYCFKIYK